MMDFGENVIWICHCQPTTEILKRLGKEGDVVNNVVQLFTNMRMEKERIFTQEHGMKLWN